MAVAKSRNHPSVFTIRPVGTAGQKTFSRPRLSTGRTIIGAPSIVAGLVLSSDPSATIHPGPSRPIMRAALAGSLIRGTLF